MRRLWAGCGLVILAVSLGWYIHFVWQSEPVLSRFADVPGTPANGVFAGAFCVYDASLHSRDISDIMKEAGSLRGKFLGATVVGNVRVRTVAYYFDTRTLHEQRARIVRIKELLGAPGMFKVGHGNCEFVEPDFKHQDEFVAYEKSLGWKKYPAILTGELRQKKENSQVPLGIVVEIGGSMPQPPDARRLSGKPKDQ